MDIDWSKAPKGTTGAMVATFDSTKSGGSTFVGKIEFIPSSGQRDYYIEGKDKWIYYEAPKAWIGEGPPPVGTLCDAEIYDGKGKLVWAESLIIHHHPHHSNSAAIAHGNGQLLAWASKFRPIRTPEQIAAEQRMASAYGMCAIVPTLTNVDAVALYDAGYRKIDHPAFAEGEREELINHVFKSFNVKLSEAVSIVDGGYRKPTAHKVEE